MSKPSPPAAPGVRVLVLLATLAIPFAAHADCAMQGTYVRGPRSTPATLQVRQQGEHVTFGLEAYGPKMWDGNPTVGTLSGEMETAEAGCAAAHISEDEQCTIVVEFSPATAHVHQFGRCLNFGAGVTASGTYRRQAARHREGP